MATSPDPHPEERAAMESRLTELEARYTHLQRVTEDLSEVLLAQTKQIEELQGKLERISSRTEELETSHDVPRRPEDERPPHY